MRRISLLAVAFLAGSLLISGSATAADKKPVVRFGFYPSHNREQLTILAEEFCQYLTDKTEYRFVPVVSHNYDDLIEGVGKNEVDFAWLSPLSYVKAERSGVARVLLKSVRGAEPFYYGAIVVRRDSGIRTIRELQGKRMGWAYPSSTAGFMFTKAALHAQGIDVDAYFASNTFIGGYDEIVKAVLHGRIDAGAVFANDTENRRGAWTQYLEPRDSRKLKAVFYTKPIPGDTITGSKPFIEANPKITNEILRRLLEMGDDPAGKKLLYDLYQVDYLVDAESGDYESVREAERLFPDRF
ncbi:MAG: phosphate/phosphite/phosphonate ABC transporter substrate-binding protein [Candidatus Eisenbacteria bacterium]|nr:phosphate/phosphite/phosphonate ABC transporter substrate-binding protein [Candidatus Eisenbacteria bacterium]